MIKLIEMKENLENRDFYKQLYDDAFPPEERWNFDMTLENKDNHNYKFYAILDDDVPIGLTMLWDLDDFNYGEYLAIDKNLRGKKYGSEVLTKILEILSNKLIVIEVEPYDLTYTLDAETFDLLLKAADDFDVDGLYIPLSRIM